MMATILIIFLKIDQISCSLNSIKAIQKMLCFVTIHWSQWGEGKVHSAPTFLIGEWGGCAPRPILRPNDADVEAV